MHIQRELTIFWGPEAILRNPTFAKKEDGDTRRRSERKMRFNMIASRRNFFISWLRPWRLANRSRIDRAQNAHFVTVHVTLKHQPDVRLLKSVICSGCSLPRNSRYWNFSLYLLEWAFANEIEIKMRAAATWSQRGFCLVTCSFLPIWICFRVSSFSTSPRSCCALRAQGGGKKIAKQLKNGKICIFMIRHSGEALSPAWFIDFGFSIRSSNVN